MAASSTSAIIDVHNNNNNIKNNNQERRGSTDNSPFTEVSGLFPRLLHILVVDDSSINKRVLERMLARFDKVAWVSVSDGQEAVKACESKLFDVILMDLYMPVLNGIDASREIMNISRTRQRKPVIVAVTASVTEEIKKECIEDMGMAGFISKPINVQVSFKSLPTSFLSSARDLYLSLITYLSIPS